jgi:hypothetical protein
VCEAITSESMPCPRTPWRLLLGLYLLSLLVLGLLAPQVSGPTDVDSAYYFLAARSLAQGRGLVVDALWHFFQPAQGFPQPAGDLWMPLPSLLMAPGLLFGTTFRYAQAVQVLLAALLPLLACQVARREGAPLPWAGLAGLFTLFAGTVTVHWLDSDCYTAYALVGGAALYTMGNTGRSPRWLAAGGLLGGLAAITRNDGILLLAVLWLAALLSGRRQGRFPWKPLLLGTALFLLPVVLWALRNVLVFGQPTPVSLAFFLTLRDYRTLLAYRPQPDWVGFWQQGWATFLGLRWGALQGSLLILVQDLQVWQLLPLLGVMVGLRRRPSLWPAFLYLGLLCLALVGAFPLLVTHGTWPRSLSAFLPTAYACTALGLWRLAERLSHWRPALPQRLVHGILLATGLGLALLVGWTALTMQLESARAHPDTWQRVGEWLQQNSAPEEVVMAADPMSVVLYGDRRAIGIPWEEPPRLLEIAQEYDARKVVLVGRFGSLLPQTLQELYAAGGSEGPFTLLWQEGEIQVYSLR